METLPLHLYIKHLRVGDNAVTCHFYFRCEIVCSPLPQLVETVTRTFNLFATQPEVGSESECNNRSKKSYWKPRYIITFFVPGKLILQYGKKTYKIAFSLVLKKTGAWICRSVQYTCSELPCRIKNHWVQNVIICSLQALCSNEAASMSGSSPNP